MSSAAVGTHSGAGPLSLMSCVRESSPLQDCDSDTEKNVASKRRFWNPRKWFKRKNKVTEDVVVIDTTEIKDALRSRSTSELSVAEEGRRRSSGSMHPGLSVSHDSVFHSPNSGSDMDLDAAQSSSSLSISQPHADLRLQSELSERLRLRRGRGDTSEDDEGLPHSPCNSPTTSDGLLLDKTAIKDLPTKSHSTCSDGSLLSMGSYEMDDDSIGPQSRHSSKVSLHEKKTTSDSHFEFGQSMSIQQPLNHSAAHHRVSVKPKRTHGAPRRKRGQQLSIALPATPEVNEDSSVRSMSPESNRKETLTELYSMSTTTSTRTLTETQLKCSSLPPGLTAPGAESSKLNRSKSNAGSKSQDYFSPLQEEEKEEKLSIFDRLFPRKSGRKKKHKEEKEAVKYENQETGSYAEENIKIRHEQSSESSVLSKQEITTTTTSVTKSSSENSSVTTYNVLLGPSRRETSKPIPAPRSGPATRQRILPCDIPATPDEVRRDVGIIYPKPSPEKTMGSSPLQAELENRFKQRQVTLSSSPTVPKGLETPPQSPKSPMSFEGILPTVISSKTEHSHFTKTSTNFTHSKLRGEEFHSRVKIPGLSSLQQRVLSLNDDDTDNSFKSLTEFPNEGIKITKPVTKSHSFKATKKISEGSDAKSTTESFLKTERDDSRIAFTKAASLDSVKNLDDKLHISEAKLELKRSKIDIRRSEESLDKITAEADNKKRKEFNDNELFRDNTITITGPSHTAVVNITSNNNSFVSSAKKQTTETIDTDSSHMVSVKEQQVSVTKIQVKRESSQVTQSTVTVPKASVPEFLHKQLNKVETRPSSNIIFSMKSPKIIEESKERPKTLFDFDVTDVSSRPPAPRKFSKENLEIIEKSDTEQNDLSPKTPPIVSVASVALPLNRFKKNEIKTTPKKSSVISITSELTKEKHLFKSRSESLDSLKSDVNESDKSSQDSLDKLDEDIKTKGSPTSDTTVVLRRKSLANKKNDEEPELMKVFARRSLKLKDNEIEAIQDSLSDIKTRDSDKENQIDSPVDDRKKWFTKTSETVNESEIPSRRKSVENTETKPSTKEPLVENKVPEIPKNNKDTTNDSPPTMRRTYNNNIFLGQRAVSLNTPKMSASELIIKKQSSFLEQRKSERWLSNVKNEDSELKEKILNNDDDDDLISEKKSEFITEPKNFSQRKAEWEKRAQLAQKKTTP